MPHIADGPLAEESIASAGTCNIGGTTKVRVEISGTTTITSFGTSANKIRWGRFSGALTLTHNGTSLILPGAANITTVAGDTFFAASDGSGNWRVSNYSRSSGFPIVYSTSTYTPAISFAGASVGVTYSTQQGTYRRNGDQCLVWLRAELTAKGSSTGALRISLPFASNATYYGGLTINFIRNMGVTAPVVALINPGTSYVEIYKFDTGGMVALTDADCTNTSDFVLSGPYLTA